MEYYNELHLQNILLETVAAIKFEKDKLSYLDNEILDFEYSRKYLSLSVEKLRDLIDSKKIPSYYNEDNNIYFRKSELDFWYFFNNISTTEDFNAAANRIMSFNMRS